MIHVYKITVVDWLISIAWFLYFTGVVVKGSDNSAVQEDYEGVGRGGGGCISRGEGGM